jgi:glycosyltransferase involved in cell wall biosynthesis
MIVLFQEATKIWNISVHQQGVLSIMCSDLRISIVIPAYNEECSIGSVLEQFNELREIEIIVVDDGSEDKTYDCAVEKGVRVFRHPYNKGYGAALKTGIRRSTGDVICFFDADNQHRVDDLREMLKFIGEYDSVIAMRTSESHVSTLRKPGKKILSFVANYLSNHRIPDLNCGLRAFKREILERIFHILPDGFSFSTTSTIAMYKMGYTIKWVPVTTLPRIGKSTVRQLKHGSETLILITRLIALFDPLKVFLPISVFLVGIGVIYQIALIFLKGFHIVGGAILTILAGILIFFFGILADQISELRRNRIE